jgi:hypothetical protein
MPTTIPHGSVGGCPEGGKIPNLGEQVANPA